MNEKQLRQIKELIQDTIKITVNGKIDALRNEVNVYIKEDNEWKDRANPTVQLGNNIRGFGKVVAYILGTAGMLFGLFKFIFSK